MKRTAPLLLALLLMGCASKSWLYKGVTDGVDISYRWNHPAGKPSELLLRLENKSTEDKAVSLVLDLFYQGRTLETLMADTCIRVGQTLNGKVNGIYFIPERVTTEQIKDGGTAVELTNTSITPAVCP
jgi:hypothetical protein